MTIAAETRKMNPGGPRERESSVEERPGRGLEKGGYEREEIQEEKRERRIERVERRK